MTTLAVFVLASYGATAILAWGKVLDPIRPAAAFFHCPQCVGFWVGVAFGALGFEELLASEHPAFRLYLLGVLASGASFVISSSFDDDGIRISHRQ